MSTMVDIKNTDLAAQKASELDRSADDLQTLCGTLKGVAENVDTLNQTFSLNEQTARYLREVSAELEKIVPELKNVVEKVNAAIKSAQGFEELNNTNFLGNA